MSRRLIVRPEAEAEMADASLSCRSSMPSAIPRVGRNEADKYLIHIRPALFSVQAHPRPPENAAYTSYPSSGRRNHSLSARNDSAGSGHFAHVPFRFPLSAHPKCLSPTGC